MGASLLPSRLGLFARPVDYTLVQPRVNARSPRPLSIAAPIQPRRLDSAASTRRDHVRRDMIAPVCPTMVHDHWNLGQVETGLWRNERPQSGANYPQRTV